MRSEYRNPRHLLVALAYGLLAVVSLSLGYLLRFEFAPPATDLRLLLAMLPWLLVIKLLVMILMGQFNSLLSFFSVPDFLRIVRSSLCATAALFVLWYSTGGQFAPPRSVLVMDGIFFIGLVSGSRLLLRNIRDQWESVSRTSRHFEPVAIVGAGDAGAQLAQQLMRHASFGLTPEVFLDDDHAKWGHQLHGVRIVGGPDWLLGPNVPPSLHRVIIAMPSAPRKRIRTIVQMLEGRGFHLDTIFSMTDLIESKSSLTRLRPVQIDDLLGRSPAQLNSKGIHQMLAGRVVAVTGAGGSIGSELCRQILRCQPEKLLLIEQSEGLLFIIEQELIEAGFKPLIVPLVADVCDAERIQGIFSEYHPALLFHAAAHKHVPMMESQPMEAIKNNAMGTAQLARAASQAGVQRFVLISTDKAINPTNVMGATKRMAEMFLQAWHAQHRKGTKFISVRFGNVLGSSGSVVPIFLKQISAGGPVKVTHPEVTRYFMTIPEAVGLVLQSGLMGQGGEIFLLDMGKPVKILDLARSLIRLQGLKPDEDIPIQFTGLRPGEKMFEELNYHSEQLQLTEHHRIFRLTTTAPSLKTVNARLAELQASFNHVTVDELKFQMTRLVPEYTPRLKETKPQTDASPKASQPPGDVSEDVPPGPPPPEKPTNLAQPEFF
jgi:FlaA1/EpsC-like NDP-sugar epimerase